MARGLPPLHERLRTLREKRGLSQPALYREAEGVSFETLRRVETPPSSPHHRYPSPDVLRAIAQALDVEPASIPEYRLALLRRALDERQSGLDAALDLLERLEPYLPDDLVDELSGPGEAVLPGPPAGGVLERLLEEGDELLAEDELTSDEAPAPRATKRAGRRRRSA